jgi:hypothetical protein
MKIPSDVALRGRTSFWGEWMTIEVKFLKERETFLKLVVHDEAEYYATPNSPSSHQRPKALTRAMSLRCWRAGRSQRNEQYFIGFHG